MIFVTVGTHEQQFDRLVRAVDELVKAGKIQDEVIVQTGFCTYEPTECVVKRFVSPEEMVSLLCEADVVITHGGPSSFVEAMGAGKVPVVVPRKKEHGEHVNNHQVEFVRTVAERRGGIIPVLDTADLLDAMNEAATLSGCVAEHNSATASFCDRLRALIEEL